MRLNPLTNIDVGFKSAHGGEYEDGKLWRWRDEKVETWTRVGR